ncbi:MAG: hypothetical protein ACLUOI_20225 [Eisenbergiella sp.]
MSMVMSAGDHEGDLGISCTATVRNGMFRRKGFLPVGESYEVMAQTLDSLAHQ